MPTPSAIPSPELQARVEREVVEFDQFFIRPVSDGGAGNQEPLLPFEKALLRTYLYARYSGMFFPPKGN